MAVSFLITPNYTADTKSNVHMRPQMLHHLPQHYSQPNLTPCILHGLHSAVAPYCYVKLSKANADQTQHFFTSVAAHGSAHSRTDGDEVLAHFNGPLLGKLWAHKRPCGRSWRHSGSIRSHAEDGELAVLARKLALVQSLLKLLTQFSLFSSGKQHF